MSRSGRSATALPVVTIALAIVALGCKANRAGATPAAAPGADVIATSAGDVLFTPINHGTLLLRFAGKAVYVDPTSKGTYDGLPKGDLFLITHGHPDHLDPATVAALRKDSAVIVGPTAVAASFPAGFTAMKNGDTRQIAGITIEAVPAYNLLRGPAPGQLFHARGDGNGYVLGLGDKRVYLSGDTECTPEMKALTGIDVAFVCMNLPYTMPPSEAAECVGAFKPKVVYPYHSRGSDLADLQSRLSHQKAVEVRIRTWY